MPFDISKGKTFKKWVKGNHKEKIWKKHVLALDLMYNAMDSLLLNGTLWNYNAHNRNDLQIGDGWNQEDCSLFSEDQLDNPNDINSGGRAKNGWLRPFAHFIQGTPIKMIFNRKSGNFLLNYHTDMTIEAPTVLFIPDFQYPNGYKIEVSGVLIKFDKENNLIFLKAEKTREIIVIVSRK